MIVSTRKNEWGNRRRGGGGERPDRRRPCRGLASGGARRGHWLPAPTRLAAVAPYRDARTPVLEWELFHERAPRVPATNSMVVLTWLC